MSLRAAGVLLVLATCVSHLRALPFRRPPRPWELQRLNASLHGKILDFTRNHGADRRIWSPALQERRDLYVYLPPEFNPCQRYPLLIWLHGFSQDEKNTKSLAEVFDAAIKDGQIPPMLIAIPDGTFQGHPTMTNSGSFYINGRKGRFEDFLACDVYSFMMQQFPLRPEREAHVLAGASMGGTSAFSLGLKHREKFGVLVGIMPLLDLMWADCHGNPKGGFSPDCIGRMDRYRPWQSAGRIWGINIRYGQAMRPVFGRRAEVQRRLPGENPVDQLELYNVQPGEFAMFVAYGGRDQFNGDAQNQHFIHRCQQRGIELTVVVNPTGRHSRKTGMSFFDDFAQWISVVLAPYAPTLREDHIESKDPSGIEYHRRPGG